MEANAVGKEADAQPDSRGEVTDDEESREFWEGAFPDETQADDGRVRRNADPPYDRDKEGRLKCYGNLVSNGGYLDGVLVDKDYEEEMYGPFTKEDLEEEEQVARELAVEPRSRRPKGMVARPQVQDEGITDKEYEPKRMMRDPGQPSREEIEEHNVDHTPYRAWCPSCVKARAIGLTAEKCWRHRCWGDIMAATAAAE